MGGREKGGTEKSLTEGCTAEVHAEKSIGAGSFIALLLLIIVILFGGILCMMGGDNSSTFSPVSAEVEAYEPLIRQYVDQYGIGEYVELIKAVMMQESGGKGLNPMQSSEGGFNTRYPREPNGITDLEYSIQCCYIESGVIPEFSLCWDGAAWFDARGQLQDGSYVPAPGDIIFFGWGTNGSIDHVGIVESVSSGVVNTVEGNQRLFLWSSFHLTFPLLFFVYHEPF